MAYDIDVQGLLRGSTLKLIYNNLANLVLSYTHSKADLCIMHYMDRLACIKIGFISKEIGIPYHVETFKYSLFKGRLLCIEIALMN